jgi:3-hydroxyisobutyrate dehydrogenase
MTKRVESVAVLGTGIMGAPIARNLAKAGLDVTAWNRTREKAEPLVEDGVQVADSAAEAARGADAVMTMLADGDAVRETMEAHDGGLSGIDGDTVWIQASTVGVDALADLAELADGRGVPFLDAPVLGTKKPAEEAKLVVLAGGAEDIIGRCRPAFDAIGQRTVETGGVGSATRLKLVVNNWLLALTAGLGETIALADALGVDASSFLDLIDDNPVGSPYAQLKGKMMIDGQFDPSFPLSLALKDVHLVLEAANEAGLDPEVGAAVKRRFEAAAEEHGDEDMAAVYLASRARAAR